MANPKLINLHSFSMLLLLIIFSLAISEPASARSLNGPAAAEKNSGNMPPSVEDNGMKLGLRYEAASLMNMLPRGTVPVSGPSRRINNANN